jgi:Tol biopolymer transport system component/DNA-binding winged helix-turn-helix (wHTH) protein
VVHSRSGLGGFGSMSDPSGHVPRLVHFGVYQLDLHSGELRKSGARLSLQQQPLQLLSVLLEHPGEIVTRDELRKRLWPDDTFVDFEHGLNAAVKRLRDTLGDSADSPRFVETVPRRGYRFIAPTSVDGPSSLPSTATAITSEGFLPRVKRGWPLLIAALVISIAALWIYRPENRIGSADLLTAVPFTSLAGQEAAPTFSQDGTQIAFAWSPEGLHDQFDLYVKVIGSERLLQLTKRPADFIIPAWSPDGRQIAFARLSREGSGIYLISPLGGSERKLTDTDHLYFVQAMFSWSPDGRYLAFQDKGPSGQFGISLLDVVTLKKHWWDGPSGGCVWSRVPAFSPDGTSLAVACTMNLGVNDLFVGPASGGPGRRVAHVQGDFSGMTWTADSRSVIFGLNGDLWRVAAAGGEPERLLAGQDAAMPTISRDGRRLAYTTQRVYNVNLWQVMLETPTRSMGSPVKVIASSRTHSRPAFSPDGRRLVFESTRSGTQEVWIGDADGSNPLALTASGGPYTGTPRWSPDGHSIAFDSHTDRGPGIYVVGAAGGQSKRVNIGVASSEPAWSNDGRWFYFTGWIGGVTQIFKVPIEGGEPTQLTTKGGFAPRMPSVDGRIYYSRDQEIWSVSLAGGDERRLTGVPLRPAEFVDSWGLSAAGVYFINPDPSRPSIDFFAFASARIVRVVDMPGRPAPWSGALALSPDGRRLVYSQLDGIASDILLLDNFR